MHNIYDQLILTMPTKATPPIYKGAVLSGLGCQSDEAARVAVKRLENVSNIFTKFFGFDSVNYLINQHTYKFKLFWWGRCECM